MGEDVEEGEEEWHSRDGEGPVREVVFVEESGEEATQHEDDEDRRDLVRLRSGLISQHQHRRTNDREGHQGADRDHIRETAQIEKESDGCRTDACDDRTPHGYLVAVESLEDARQESLVVFGVVWVSVLYR